MPTKTEGLIIAGSAVGVTVPLIVREYYDTQKEEPNPPTGEFVFDWKRPSALVGLGGGAAMLLLGLFGHKISRGISQFAPFMVAAGPSMIAAGAYSAMYPKYPGGTARAYSAMYPKYPGGTARARSARAGVVPVSMARLRLRGSGVSGSTASGKGIQLRS